jgi:hypothetical protein
MPESRVSAMKAARTTRTGQPRCRASPAETPVARQERGRLSLGRGARGTGASCAFDDIEASKQSSTVGGASLGRSQGAFRDSPHSARMPAEATIEL